MRMLDLFAGIGGFSLAAHWMGWETAAFVEWDSFAQKVLRKNFSNVPIHGDIKQFDGTQYKGSVDIICGGFPCQPFSTAGKRKGKADDRYLWPEMLRVISEVRPTWVVGENVAGILSMDGGAVLRQIRTDLENAGYWSEVFGIPAIGVGAPHQRQRVWIVANTNSEGLPIPFFRKFRSIPKEIRTPARREPGRAFPTGKQWGKHWLEVATRLCRMDDGVPAWVDAHRTRRLKALGNAIVPQVAYEIFRAIQTTNQ